MQAIINRSQRQTSGPVEKPSITPKGHGEIIHNRQFWRIVGFYVIRSNRDDSRLSQIFYDKFFLSFYSVHTTLWNLEGVSKINQSELVADDEGGLPGGIQTRNPPIENQELYSIELRGGNIAPSSARSVYVVLPTKSRLPIFPKRQPITNYGYRLTNPLPAQERI